MEGKSKVSARRSSDDQLLASDAMDMLAYIANLTFPNEEGDGFWAPEMTKRLRSDLKQELQAAQRKLQSRAAGEITERTKRLASRAADLVKGEEFFRDLRKQTEKYWPELWAKEAGQRPPDSMVRQMRRYLQLFWREPDPRARDWYIHRAREFYQENRILRETRGERQAASRATDIDDALYKRSMVEIHMNELLDEPPPHTRFEDALFELQERARWPSKSPLYCKNPNCRTTPGHRGPYFLNEKKGTKYCCAECSHAGVLASKNQSWARHKQNWRKK